MDKRKVFVLVPTYNRSDYLMETLESIVANTFFPNVSLIVFNNASSDDGYEKIEQFLNNFENSRYLRFDENLPWYKNWNRCLTYVKDADYVAIYQDDDLYDPRIIEKQVEFLERHESAGLVATWGWKINSEGNIIGDLINEKIVELSPGRKFIEECMRDGNFFECASVMYRFPALGKKPFREDSIPNWAKDNLTWLTIAEQWDIGCIREKLIKKRFHSGQLSHLNEEHTTSCVANNLLLYANEFKSRYPEERKKMEEWEKKFSRRTVMWLLRRAVMRIQNGEDIKPVLAAFSELEVKPGWVLGAIQNRVLQIRHPGLAMIVRKILGAFFLLFARIKYI